ncbi:hypothetical protein ABK040_008451 [Willaertia magna]
MPPKQFKKSFAAQGKLEQQRKIESIRERELHLKAKTYIDHLVKDFILKTIVFENKDQLPNVSDMKEILLQSIKQQEQVTVSSHLKTNTIYSEIERYIDDYSKYLLEVMANEISKEREIIPQIEFNIDQVIPIEKGDINNFENNFTIDIEALL